jgi:hypothetical protein
LAARTVSAVASERRSARAIVESGYDAVADRYEALEHEERPWPQMSGWPSCSRPSGRDRACWKSAAETAYPPPRRLRNVTASRASTCRLSRSSAHVATSRAPGCCRPISRTSRSISRSTPSRRSTWSITCPGNYTPRCSSAQLPCSAGWLPALHDRARRRARGGARLAWRSHVLQPIRRSSHSGAGSQRGLRDPPPRVESQLEGQQEVAYLWVLAQKTETER